MRYLNGFILIGMMLVVISIAGAATGNRFLTEPGQQPNPYAWIEYLGAAVLMFINGILSIKLAKNAAVARAVSATKTDAEPASTEKPTQDN